MGLRAHHNFVANPKIAGYVVMARGIPCLCAGCSLRLKMPIGDWYVNQCNDCEYYSMFNGWNDWRRITFQPAIDCDMEEFVQAQEWTLQKIGERMASLIKVKKFGAYLVSI